MALRILTFLVLSIFSTQVLLQESPKGEFPIGVGDTLVISVYNEADLFVKVKVDSTGVVKMPLIGEVKVKEKSPSVLEQEIEAALFDGYLTEPDVSVTVAEFRPFFIKGAVKLPGAYDFRLNLTVNQAIAIGGGLKDRASKSDWYILRGANREKISVSKENQVAPGDIIQIEESIF